MRYATKRTRFGLRSSTVSSSAAEGVGSGTKKQEGGPNNFWVAREPLRIEQGAEEGSSQAEREHPLHQFGI